MLKTWIEKWNSLRSDKAALVCEEGETDWFDVAILLRKTEKLLIVNNPLCPESLYWCYRAFSEDVKVAIWNRDLKDLSKIASPYGFKVIKSDNWIDCWKEFQEL